MRVFGYSLAVAALAATCASPLHSQTVDAAQVLAAAREALGGDSKLSAVKTFTATGRTRQVRGNNLVPIEFEINCELPDKFVRKDESPAQDTDPTTLGFSGDTLILFPLPSAGPQRGRGGGPAQSPAQQRLATVKQDFARLTLAMFAASFPSFPLTFKYAGQGEAPEGKADVLDVSGPTDFAARFVVQRETHLPVMLMWQGPPTPTQPKPADFRLYYADFRDVDGLKLPFRIRRAIGSETIEETTLDRIKINAKIDPRKFEVPK
jgi:hypothetical protein